MVDREIEQYIKDLDSRLISVAEASKKTRYQAIVDAPFQNKMLAVTLDLGIVVLLLVDEQKENIQRVALSKTEPAKGSVLMSAKPFADIKIPTHHERNIIATAIDQHTPQYTEDWSSLFVPALTSKQARFNQAGASIECSYVYPLNVSPGGALIFSYLQPHEKLVDEAHHLFMAGYCNRVSWFLNKINSQAG